MGQVDADPACRADPGSSSCSVCALLDLFGRKWTIHLLRVIGEEGPVRFNALKRAAKGITPRVLSDRLSQLEEAGLVDRVDHGTVPPRVEYALTEKGEDLERLFEAHLSFARRWGEPFPQEEAL